MNAWSARWMAVVRHNIHPSERPFLRHRTRPLRRAAPGIMTTAFTEISDRCKNDVYIFFSELRSFLDCASGCSEDYKPGQTGAWRCGQSKNCGLVKGTQLSLFGLGALNQDIWQSLLTVKIKGDKKTGQVQVVNLNLKIYRRLFS